MRLASLTILLTAALSCACFGGETDPNILAMGAWSKPVRSSNYLKLRGRLLICDYHERAALYVELQECSDSVGAVEEVHWDPQAVACQLTDRDGKPVPLSPGAYGGPMPSACWIKLPSGSSMILRVSPYAGGRLSDGSFKIWTANMQVWRLKPNDTATYFLSGEFTAKTTNDHKSDNPQWIWTGKLQLPKMELTLAKLQPTAPTTHAEPRSR
jgi:hypothetical protein